eukprot:TRINITY_DN15724_c0_g1_i1.p1 TRINITY_DN15724_c0_g1~~TRINITY_DN15724_c0_g1_i1.p1  ORF type:complete len:370 (+),score=54.78 TRINITY_DN15724_c0_g1_i1:63-1172(+)
MSNFRVYILGYYFALLVLALPGWWVTTMIERTELPEADLSHWCNDRSRLAVPPLKGGFRMSFAPEYVLHFALVQAEPTERIKWDFRKILPIIQPFLHSFGPAVSFSVESQIVHYAAIADVALDPQAACYAIPAARAYNVLSPQQWLAESSSGTTPTIKFAIFVPPASMRPLCIRNSKGTLDGFIVPRWGGISIWNPSNGTTELSDAELQSHVELFAGQLAQMLGYPHEDVGTRDGLERYTRTVVAALLADSVRKACSLATLIAGLPQVVVGPVVANGVQQTLYLAGQTEAELHKGNVHQAALHARAASQLAEGTFFDPSVVAQLYFPTEHKYALYLPLLGPVCIPIFVNLLRELKRRRDKRRKTAQQSQ